MTGPGYGKHKLKVETYVHEKGKSLARVTHVDLEGDIAKIIKPGEITFMVLAKNSTNEPHRLIVASLGVAIPSGKNNYGYLSEHHTFGQTDEVAGEYAEDLAATMLATTMGLQFDPEVAWDERKQSFKTSGLIIKTANITQSATGDKNGLWTTTVAAAVFVPTQNHKLLKK